MSNCFGSINLAICYKNLWKMLIDRNMNKIELKEASGIRFNVMVRMSKNEVVSFEGIEKIYSALNCDIGDIISITQDAKREMKTKTFKTVELFVGVGGLVFVVEKGELALLPSGALCQSFSYAGKRLGLEDAGKQSSIIIQSFSSAYSLKCSYLKMSGDCLLMTKGKHIKLLRIFLRMQSIKNRIVY